MYKNISLIICCFNSEKTIEVCLEAIKRQKNLQNIKFEVLLIDNNSTDRTVEKAQKLWGDFSMPLKIVKENKQGLLYAKLKGCKKASYDLLGYIDDDNILHDDWVQKSISFMNLNHDCGVSGGENFPFYKITPPNWFSKYEKHYAVGKQGSQLSEDVTETRGFVWGAGMVIKKDIINKGLERGFSFVNVGRTSTSLSSGEDVEFCWLVRKLGKKVFYNGDQKLKHMISPNRMTWDYLSNLQLKFGRASVWFDVYEYSYSKYRIFGSNILIIIKLLFGSFLKYLGNLTKYMMSPKNKVDNIYFLKTQFFKGRILELSIKNYLINSEKIDKINKSLS
ncbi:glycosyltransferase [Flammeovirga agarivorans]|uniref:Glycosyltransferase family 2 protein n=1 Tax=Flammeovirga agarivorans TaxID=2726742 RepID=A0A7X8SLN1_9BACT|nr:glycosyltransferase [Flammeovirga agarivorans]NLR92505.1 glycosyltransferase family 2 protein [Flammeovirga agarivorans]